MKGLCLLFTLMISLNVSAESTEIDTCIDKGELRYTYRLEKKTTPSSYCFNKERTILVSKNCKPNLECEANKIAKQNKGKDLNLFNSGVGSPGFYLCYNLNGRPQIIEFYDGKEWFKLDRCMFSKDDSYVDTGTLMKMWSQK